MDRRVEALQRRAAADPRVIGLAGGLPAPEQFPRGALARAFLRALGETGAPGLQYGWAEGSEGLRRFVAERLRARGAGSSAEDVIITNGAQQAIAIALEIVGRPGDRVGVDAETYPAALDLLRTRGLIPVAVADRQAAASVRAFYAMPALGNPTGQALSPAARAALLDAAAPIIEDDAYADLRFDGAPARPLLADAPERVFHVGTLSKTLCPGLRLGWLVAPRRHRRRALRIKRDSDLQACGLAQAVVEKYLSGLDFDAWLDHLRRFYRRRAGALARALRVHLPSWRFVAPQGGFAIWVEADGRVHEEQFLRAAIDEGVVFDPGSQFRPPPLPVRASSATALRLCFSSANGGALDEGVRRLARAWHGTQAAAAGAAATPGTRSPRAPTAPAGVGP